jgi:adenylate kinase family enzyme
MGTRLPAILLLGPTGSGKTPLGELLEARGLNGRKCAHFDFGENLRQIVARGRPDELVSSQDIDFLRGVLERGALLEDKDFSIAQRILRSFINRRAAGGDALVVLNGLPRHVGQAEDVSEILDVRLIVRLECSSATAFARIASNTGGDRTDRVDDNAEAIRQKLLVFAQRTAPLIEYYRNRGVRVVRLETTADTTPEQVWEMLATGDTPAI